MFDSLKSMFCRQLSHIFYQLSSGQSFSSWLLRANQFKCFFPSRISQIDEVISFLMVYDHRVPRSIKNRSGKVIMRLPVVLVMFQKQSTCIIWLVIHLHHNEKILSGIKDYALNVQFDNSWLLNFKIFNSKLQ